MNIEILCPEGQPFLAPGFNLGRGSAPLGLAALLLAADPQTLREVGRILRRATAEPAENAGVLGLELRRP